MARSHAQTLVVLAALCCAVAVVRFLLGSDGIGFTSNPVIMTLRSERIVSALCVGASLGVAGALLQAILRNPLASPFLLGLTSGASLGVTAWTAGTYLLTGSVLGGVLPIAPAMAGAFIALGLVYALSSQRGVPEPTTLILVGVIVTIVCGAITSFLQQLLPDQGLASIMRWGMGALSDDVPLSLRLIVAGATIGGTLWAVRLGPMLDVAALPDDEAQSVGVSLGGLRARAVLIAGVLTAGSVALAGPIGFVGLLGPHIARRLVGGRHAESIIAAAIVGGLLVLTAETVSAGVRLPTGRLPIGVLTAIVGGPFMILLLRRGQRA